MSAQEIALGGRQSRNGWWAVDCVICGGKGKLGIKGGRRGLIISCFRGCSASEIRAELQRLDLFDPDNQKRAPKLTTEELRQRREADEVKRARRITEAQWIWEKDSVDAKGTPADVYLASRLIWFDEIPESIRFRHGYAKRNIPPAMVCRIDHVEYGPIGVHLTFLSYEGRKASVDPARKVIGACGGGSVHFGEPRPDQWLVIGEGVESTLSMALSIGAPAWAALSAPGIKSLILPPDARMVLVASDNDVNGTGQKAANAAATRWLAEGRRIKICVPPHPGVDWNDVLMAGRLDGRRDHAA